MPGFISFIGGKRCKTCTGWNTGIRCISMQKNSPDNPGSLVVIIESYPLRKVSHLCWVGAGTMRCDVNLRFFPYPLVHICGIIESAQAQCSAVDEKAWSVNLPSAAVRHVEIGGWTRYTQSFWRRRSLQAEGTISAANSFQEKSLCMLRKVSRSQNMMHPCLDQPAYLLNGIP